MSINILLKSVFKALAVSPPCSVDGKWCLTVVLYHLDWLSLHYNLMDCLLGFSGLSYMMSNMPTLSLLHTKPRPSVWVKSSYTFTQAASQTNPDSLFLYN